MKGQSEIMSLTQVSLLRGRAAEAVLSDPRFLDHWRNLHGRCPHATAFQSPGFVRAWYRAYCAQWQPVVAQSEQVNGELAGLWLLAYDPVAGVLAHAGTHQAEYQVWLALPGLDAGFLAAAWKELKQALAFSALVFKYLPNAALADTLATVDGMQECAKIRSHRRPLLNLDADAVKASFSKKSNKSRVNRLKRLGKIEFRRLTDPAELDVFFDKLIAFYDFRQGAINSTTPFREDRHKRAFHRALLADADSGAYVTVTLLDGEPIAAFWGSDSGRGVHLGMLFYSPLLAEHSPGKLHIMDLSAQLLRDGKQVLDLTPGGDAWKDRFANAHDAVAEAVVYASTLARRRADGQEYLLHLARRCAAAAGVSTATARSFAARLVRVRPAQVIRKLSAWTTIDREFRVYRATRSLAASQQADERVRCNALPDLLSFEPGEPWQSRDGFLSSALERIENGTRAYTVCIDDRLAHVGWLTHGLQSYMTEVKQSMTFPVGSVALFDFYSHPDFRGRGLYRATISHMLQQAFADEAIAYAYISVLADNAPSRHVIEKIGFEYQGSYFWQRRFGNERKWASPSFCLSEAANA